LSGDPGPRPDEDDDRWTTTVLTVVGPIGGEDHHAGRHRQAGHPERPSRIDAVMDGIADLHLDSDLRVVEPRPADPGQLARVHGSAYLDRLRQLCESGGGHLDEDTYATAESWDAALLSAGAGLAAVDALVADDAGVAFVAARPPGHHALPDRSMGFCLINNVAVAARSLVDAGERVLIVDWDVHHGNGTQAIFWDEPDVLYVSTHQWPCYPGTGRPDEVGGTGARGSILNVPLPPGATGDVLGHAFERVVGPAVDEFSPTWVLVSAGFDAHRADPLADLALSSGDFADLAAVVAGYAPAPGRLVLFLEGGYDLAALRSSVAASLGRLVGAPALREPATSGGPGTSGLNAVIDLRLEALEGL
jgi:acetoin utilization deacetylase AcuC-like enzyme